MSNLHKKHRGKKLHTDDQTDFLFDYFFNEDKFNDQLRPEWKEEMEKKLENHKQPREHITEREREKEREKERKTSEIQKELPSISESEGDTDKNRREKADVDFNYSSDSDDKIDLSSENFAKSPYGKKIDANEYNKPDRFDRFDRIDRIDRLDKLDHGKGRGLQRYHEHPKHHKYLNKIEHGSKPAIGTKPLLGKHLIEDIEEYVEMPEEKRARTREIYTKLQDLVETHKVKLSRSFSIDDDPDEMEAEYAMQKDRRKKQNGVKFYGKILLNIVCGIEFVNTQWDPFNVKLEGWSTHFAADMDDNVEILEELYEKYKNIGGNTAPELRLIFAIIMSGVSYHISQAWLGSGEFKESIQKNPNVLSKLLGGLLGSNNKKSDNNEENSVPNNTKSILDALKKHNKNKPITTTTTEHSHATNKLYTSDDLSTMKSPTNIKKQIFSTQPPDQILLEKERKMLEEQKLQLADQMKKQNEFFMAQMNHLQNTQARANNLRPEPFQMSVQQPYVKGLPDDNKINQVLSDIGKKPRFQESNSFMLNEKNMSPNPMQHRNREFDMFASEIKDPMKFNQANQSSYKTTGKPEQLTGMTKNKNIDILANSDDLMESLDDALSSDADGIVEISNKKQNNSIPKSVKSVAKKPNNSINSTAKKSNSISENTSAAKKRQGIITL